MTTILDAKELVSKIRDEVSATTKQLRDEGITPTLAIVVATEDESTAWYVRSIKRTADTVGIETKVVELSPDSNTDNIKSTLIGLAEDSTVHGIILQTPLPIGVALDDLVTAIPLGKDVDGANPLSAGRLMSGLDAFVPATALAVYEVLKWYEVPLAGAKAVVVGRSRIVGKPAALLLLAADATVTICHSKTKDLAAITREADVLVAAVGKAKLIGPNHVGPHTVIIDVGTNVDDNGKLVGDTDAEAVTGKVKALSPVPGGVGPVTTALLLRATAAAAKKS